MKEVRSAYYLQISTFKMRTLSQVDKKKTTFMKVILHYFSNQRNKVCESWSWGHSKTKIAFKKAKDLEFRYPTPIGSLGVCPCA